MTEKKWIVITGASRGIGAEIAKTLANAETGLILLATDLDGLKDTGEAVSTAGGTAIKIACDLSKQDDIQRAWRTIEKICDGRIHSLINNAGIWIEDGISARPWNDYEIAMAVNLSAPMQLTSLCLPFMGDGSSIVFIGSIASRKSYGGGTNYCAAKFGLLGFANSLFEDVRDRGIKVVSILPGQVDTDMHKDEPGIVQDRMIDPKDVADTVKWAMNTPSRICPSEITLMPQRNPKPRK